MDIQFEVYDVYRRRVFCLKGVWYGKLRTMHGLLEADEALVREAISKPEGGFPRFDKDRDMFPDRRVYYKKSKSNDYFIKVVVEFHETNEGLTYGSVVTGYAETRIDPRETPEESP